MRRIYPLFLVLLTACVREQPAPVFVGSARPNYRYVATQPLGNNPVFLSSTNTPPEAYNSYSAQHDESLASIASRNQVNATQLAEINGLLPSSTISAGQQVLIPAAKTYTVQQGETLYSIARMNNTDVRSLVAANNLAAPYTVQSGQKLAIPAARLADQPTQMPTSYGSIAPPSAPQPFTQLSAPPPRTSGRFLWPVVGQIITPYGNHPNGEHNDGINISVKEDTPVLAADNAVVAYAGNQIRGFGNLVLLKHSDGFITTYAHNSELLVKRGEAVRRGQTIAMSGESGSVSAPQLHFEVRRGKQALNPLAYLESRGTFDITNREDSTPIN